jgi:hypothetical protein
MDDWGFGLELVQVLEGLAGGTAGTFHAPLKLGEDFAAVGGGLTERVLGVGSEAFLIGVGPELGFGGAQAAFEPLAVDEVVHESPGFGSGGMVALVVLVD